MATQSLTEQIDISNPNIEQKRMKMGNLLIFACFFLYTASMAAKGVFAAEVKYIIDMWDLTQAKAQMANTWYFVAYGLVQVFLSIIIGKIDVRKYLIVTVPIAALFTALMGVATRIEGIWVYFGLTGAFQAAIYAGSYWVLGNYLPNALLTKANKIMNMGYAVGTVVAYALSALFIGYDLWQVPYFIIALVFLLSLVVFAVVTKNAKKFAKINLMLDEVKQMEQPKNTKPLLNIKTKKDIAVFFVVALIFTFMFTSFYYAVMNFITSTLVEVHGVNQDVSIYVSIIAPIAIITGPMLTISACEKDRDFIRQTIKFLLILLPIPLLLAFFYKVNVILYLLLAVAFVVLANGIKSITLSIMVFKMKNQINTGSYSAISNAIASLAAGVAPVVIGAIKDASGWVACYWVIFFVVAIVVLLLVLVRWLLTKENNKENKKIEI